MINWNDELKKCKTSEDENKLKAKAWDYLEKFQVSLNLLKEDKIFQKILAQEAPLPYEDFKSLYLVFEQCLKNTFKISRIEVGKTFYKYMQESNFEIYITEKYEKEIFLSILEDEEYYELKNKFEIEKKKKNLIIQFFN